MGGEKGEFDLSGGEAKEGVRKTGQQLFARCSEPFGAKQRYFSRKRVRGDAEREAHPTPSGFPVTEK